MTENSEDLKKNARNAIDTYRSGTPTRSSYYSDQDAADLIELLLERIEELEKSKGEKSV
jgi:hypothetical protein